MISQLILAIKVTLQTEADELEFEVGDDVPLNAGKTAFKYAGSSAILTSVDYTAVDNEIDEFRLVDGAAADALTATDLANDSSTDDFYLVARTMKMAMLLLSLSIMIRLQLLALL